MGASRNEKFCSSLRKFESEHLIILNVFEEWSEKLTIKLDKRAISRHAKIKWRIYGRIRSTLEERNRLFGH